MAWGKKSKGKGSSSAGDDECRVCRNNGGYWARNTRTGEVRAVNCALCHRPPKGSPPA